MRRLLFFFCALLLSCPVFSQDAQTSQQKPVVLKVNGTLSKVQYVMSYIVVICEEGYLTFKVTPETVIKRGTKKASLDELDAGDSVAIAYTMNGSERVALSIRDSTVKRSY